MSNFAVLKGASYTLAFTPDMVLHNGTTQTMEKNINPDSQYLKDLPDRLRTYDDVISYMPNQVYIGNKTPDELAKLPFPWYDKKIKGSRQGKYGEIMPQDEFIGLIQICDAFDLVKIEQSFAKMIRKKLAKHELIGEKRAATLDKNNSDLNEIKKMVNEEGAEPLYNEGNLIGAIKRAHDVDVNLSSHVMMENLVSKASNVLSLLHLLKVSGINSSEIDYVIDCCEEACGDMNQRGGGNFAKAAAETAGLENATGSDTRSFCAGPAHAILLAASLIKAGTYKKVVVTAGGCSAKLGMNGKDHVKKNIPILEDCIAGFSVILTEDDGISPHIRNDIVGKHNVGTGSSPQAVIESLVTSPLEKAGIKITDVDKFSPEMQNPDITKHAGAGDVPEANYKMIAALGVKKGEIKRENIQLFVKEHGLTGWAPTQGHIPSGVPYLGFARDSIINGEIKRTMIIGKGSLFLGRMTNLFDGVSFVVDRNENQYVISETPATNSFRDESDIIKAEKNKESPIIGIAVKESEHGSENIEEAIEIARSKGLNVVKIKDKNPHQKMEDMLTSNQIDGAVTMHYSFPIGVSTVGKVVTPSEGRTMYISTTTGTSDVDNIRSMVKNAIYGIIAAKADGVNNPTIGIANLNGAQQCEKALNKLKANGYDIKFKQSARADGGIKMRGNDLLMGTADIMVMDSLTGNLMTKIFSSYTTGGNYESFGWGYGPGVGEGFDKIISIVSRASGAPVIANAVEFTSNLVKRDLIGITKQEFEKANRAGLLDILNEKSLPEKKITDEKIPIPSKETVEKEITGIDIMDIEDAVKSLWEINIYAESGMGCTGPVVLINGNKEEQVRKALADKGYI